MIATLEVSNVRCGGCANTITEKLQELGLTHIDVDLACEPRKVTVDAVDEVQLVHIKAALRELGYPLVSEENGTLEGVALKAKSFVSCAIGKFGSVNNN